jgi:hypothetical protein
MHTCGVHAESDIENSHFLNGWKYFLKMSIVSSTDELLLIRCLKFFNGNVERALKKLLASMEVRKHYSNIYHKRDPFDPRLRRLINQM